MPKPKPGETQEDFMSRCVPQVMNEGKEQDQAVAICANMFEDKASPAMIQKTSIKSASANDPMEFVLSDQSRDRMGDVIEVDGWDLTNFKQNPIALFQHKSDQPIGTWSNLRKDKATGRLLGHLNLAKAGTSPFIDGIRGLVEQNILRAVSVGFKSRKHQLMKEEDGGGIRFKEQELLEVSLVSIPANANALSVARSLNISDEVVATVFGEEAVTRRSLERVGEKSGGNATRNVDKRSKRMPTPLSQKIEDIQKKLVELKNQLEAHTEQAGDEPDESQEKVGTDIKAEIIRLTKRLDDLKETEKLLATETANDDQRQEPSREVETRQRGMGQTTAIVTTQRPYASAVPKVKPLDHVWRALTVAVKHHCEKHSRPMVDVLKSTYGEDRLAEETKVMMDVFTRAATVPADTVTSGWASQLVNTAIGDFFDTLMPASVYPGLSAKGGRFTFGRNGVISLPTRSSTPTIAGSFVGQGSPIPVRQGAFTAVTLTPKKMGVISTFTREIAEHSTPAIEGLIRQAVVEDTAVAIDTILLDATAASTIRPAGIRNGVTGGTPSAAANTFDKIVADTKALISALITGTNGNLRSPVWIMNPLNALTLTMTQNAGGDFPFRAEVNNNQFMGYPLILSTNATANTIIIVDASDFMSATGDTPRFDVSDQAVLHMDDTTPLAIGTAGSPNTVAAPTRSLWQTDTLGVRMLLDINWAFRRTGVVAFTAAVTW